MFEGLQLVHQGIQNEKGKPPFPLFFCMHSNKCGDSFSDILYPANFTRFYIIASSLRQTLTNAPKPRLRRALVRIALDPNQDSLPPESMSYHRPLHLVVSTLLTNFGVPITRVDRRPSLRPIPFDDVYFIELEELGTPLEFRTKNASPSSVSEETWLAKVQESVERVQNAGLEATLLGLW